MNSPSLPRPDRCAVLFLASLATGAVLVSTGCSKPAASVAPVLKPVLVRLAPITYSTAARPIRASGVMSRKTEAYLSFKVGGLIETVLVRPGDAVQKGQILAQLRLDEIEAQSTQANSALDKARRDFERVGRLQASDAVSVESLQDARTALELASAQVRITDFNRRFAVITAPANGRVLRRLAEPNELVAAGRPVLGFADDADGWLVKAGLAEPDVARVRLGDRVEVALPGATRGSSVGRITQISEAADPVTRTTLVEIALDEPPPQARSGFVVAVTIQPPSVASRPFVPATSLIEGSGDAASVYVVPSGGRIAQRVAVHVEALEGPTAFLSTPLPATGQLVVAGAEFLRDGATVEAVAAFTEKGATQKLAKSSKP